MQKLAPNMPNANNIQNLAQSNRKTTIENTTHTHRHQPIWIQTRTINTGWAQSEK